MSVAARRRVREGQRVGGGAVAAEALRELSANVTLSVIARLMDRPLAIDSAKWMASVTWRA
jgi:hypothetical protein